MNELHTLISIFPWSLAVGFLVATFCSIIGVYVVLKRIVFVSIALSEAAALGSAFATVVHIPCVIGSLIISLAFGYGLSRPYESHRIPRDAVLGVLFVFASAGSILIASIGNLGFEEIKALLYGDLILATYTDFLVIVCMLTSLFFVGFRNRRSIFYSFLDRDFASSIGINVVLWEKLFFIGLALAVSSSAKVAGAILVFSYLVVAPASALLISQEISRIMVLAVIFSLLSTISGLYLAMLFDLPANQLITVLLAVIFLASYLISNLKHRYTGAEGSIQSIHAE